MHENRPESKYLGKKSALPENYDPSVLVAVPRAENRSSYGIEKQIMQGWDVWHAYEAGFLTYRGLPVTGILKIVYSSETPFLVESKSLKLYLNSFNEEKLGADKPKAISTYENTVKKDLEKLVGGEVNVKLHSHTAEIQPLPWDSFDIIEDLEGEVDTDFTESNCSENLLEIDEGISELSVGTHLLKSNCKITHQPDWGSAFLHMKGQAVTPVSFLREVVSLRREDHFHEEIAEMLFKKIYDLAKNADMLLTCHYTRRGGIDINPVRYCGNIPLPTSLLNAKTLTGPAFRQ